MCTKYLQIQYATKFLVENVLSYLFDFCSHPVMPPIRSKRTVINHSTFTSNGGRGGGGGGGGGGLNKNQVTQNILTQNILYENISEHLPRHITISKAHAVAKYK